MTPRLMRDYRGPSPASHFEGPFEQGDTRSKAARELRSDISRSAIPTALVIAAGLVLVVATIEILLSGDFTAPTVAGAAATVLLLALVALATSRIPQLRPMCSWIFAVAMFVVATWTLMKFQQAPDFARPGFIAVILVALGPIVLEWIPFLTGGGAIGIATVLTAWQYSWGSPPIWASVCLLALFVSALLLYLRRRSLAALAAARLLAHQRATTDPLTGVLNRSGLDAMLPTLLATARRLQQPLVVTFIDIDGLKTANDSYGHLFGDQIIASVASALRSAGRQGDLVARWGGDEFVVVGMGVEPDPSSITERIQREIRASSIDLERWSGGVSLGVASGFPVGPDVEELIRQADDNMYAARGSPERPPLTSVGHLCSLRAPQAVCSGAEGDVVAPARAVGDWDVCAT